MGGRFVGESWDQTITIQQVFMVVMDEAAIGMKTQGADGIGTVEEGAGVRVIIIHILHIRITLLLLCSSMNHITLKVMEQIALIHIKLEEVMIFANTIPTPFMVECSTIHLVFLRKHQRHTITIIQTFTNISVQTIPFMDTI